MRAGLLESPYSRQPLEAVGPPAFGPYADPVVLWTAAFPYTNLANGSKCRTAALGTGMSVGASRRDGKELLGTGAGTGRIVFDVPPESDQISIVFTGRGNGTGANQRFWSNYAGPGLGRYDCYYDAAAGKWTLSIYRTTAATQIRLTGLPALFDGTVCFRISGTSLVGAWYNGFPISTLVTSTGSGSLVSPSSVCAILGRMDASTRQLNGGVSMLARYDSILSAEEASAITIRGGTASRVFAKRLVLLSSADAASGVAGTASPTDTSDVSAASGATTIVGIGSAVEQLDASVASGSPVVAGTAAPSDTADISAAAGAVGSAITGSAAVTDAPDSGTAAGTTTVVGVAAPSEQGDLSTATGTSPIQGTAAVTDLPDSVTAAGWAGLVSGTATPSDSPDVSVAAGTSGSAPIITQSFGNLGWDPRKRPSWKREELRRELEAALEAAPAPVKALIQAPPADTPDRVGYALHALRKARGRRAAEVRSYELQEIHDALETVAAFTAEQASKRQARRRRQQQLLLLS